jgi:hypothetical protein
MVCYIVAANLTNNFVRDMYVDRVPQVAAPVCRNAPKSCNLRPGALTGQFWRPAAGDRLLMLTPTSGFSSKTKLMTHPGVSSPLAAAGVKP